MDGRREVIAQSDILSGMSINQGARRVVMNWQVEPRNPQWDEFWRYYLASIGFDFDGQCQTGGDQ